MAKAALKRVRADLAAGRTHLAARRLRSMLLDRPADLELRRMLAAVHRQTGNHVEAGRWAFLTDTIRPHELAAFVRAHPSPWIRLRLLNYPGCVTDLPDEGARNRLHALIIAADQAGPPRLLPAPDPAPAGRDRSRRTSRIACGYVTVVMIIFGILVLIGIVRAAAWLVEFVNT